MTQRNVYRSSTLSRALVALAVMLAAAYLSALAPTPAYAADTIPIPLTVENTVTGSPAADETFTFVLEAETTGAPMPGASEVSITGSGSASFGDISFTQAGQYQYKLYERAGTTAEYTYDVTVYHVLVDASWQGGTLVTQVVAWKGDTRSDETKVAALAFNNEYRTPAADPTTAASPGDASSGGGTTSGVVGWLAQTGDTIVKGMPAFILAGALVFTGLYLRRRKD